MKQLRTKALLLALPFILAFAVFYIIPYGSVFYYSFATQTKPVSFAGFENFASVLTNEYYRMALVNTGVFTVISIPLMIVLAYFISTLLYRQHRIFKVLLFIPVLIPSASIANLWADLFPSETAWPMILLFLWKNIGLTCLIITAGLTKIPKDVMDAARIDGATTLNVHIHIILPLLSPVLFFSALVGLIQSFKIFREIYLIYQAYPPDDLYMIPHYIFNKFNKLGYAELSAGTLIFTLAIIVLLGILAVIGYYSFIKKGGRKNG